MERAEKEAEVDFLKDRFSKAQVALCANYRGLTVSKITELRKALWGQGATGRVVKNTLAKISLEQALVDADAAEKEKMMATFAGPTFLVFSEKDPVSPAKVLSDFMKENKAFVVKGAWLDGVFVDDKGIGELAKMPGKEELLGKLLNLIMAPATQLVRTIQAPGSQTVQVLEAQRKKLEEAA